MPLDRASAPLRAPTKLRSEMHIANQQGRGTYKEGSALNERSTENVRAHYIQEVLVHYCTAHSSKPPTPEHQSTSSRGAATSSTTAARTGISSRSKNACVPNASSCALMERGSLLWGASMPPRAPMLTVHVRISVTQSDSRTPVRQAVVRTSTLTGVDVARGCVTTCDGIGESYSS